jgi:hypothetical protein
LLVRALFYGKSDEKGERKYDGDRIWPGCTQDPSFRFGGDDA